MLTQFLKSKRPQPVPPPPPLSRQELLDQVSDLDWKAQKACIDFLQEQYPTISIEQVKELIKFIFENNFKMRLPNHFGYTKSRGTVGHPFIWLLNELETGGIQYLYKNNIWQIHWDISDRYGGIIRGHKEDTVKYLVTSGPFGEEEQRLWQEHNLIFFMYAGSRLDWSKYPFAEDVNLSCDAPHLSGLKAP